MNRVNELRRGRYHHRAAIEAVPNLLLVGGGAARDGGPIDSVELIAV